MDKIRVLCVDRSSFVSDQVLQNCFSVTTGYFGGSHNKYKIMVTFGCLVATPHFYPINFATDSPQVFPSQILFQIIPTQKNFRFNLEIENWVAKAGWEKSEIHLNITYLTHRKGNQGINLKENFAHQEEMGHKVILLVLDHQLSDVSSKWNSHKLLRACHIFLLMIHCVLLSCLFYHLCPQVFRVSCQTRHSPYLTVLVIFFYWLITIKVTLSIRLSSFSCMWI